jgi:hypothetical protein
MPKRPSSGVPGTEKHFERAATKQTLLLFLADCLPQTAKLSDDTWRILDLTSSSKQQSYTVRFENNCGKTLEAIAFDCDGFQGTAWGVERHGRYCVLSNHDDVQAGATWRPPCSPLCADSFASAHPLQTTLGRQSLLSLEPVLACF